MAQQTRKIRRAEVNYTTIKTRLEPETQEDYLKLALFSGGEFSRFLKEQGEGFEVEGSLSFAGLCVLSRCFRCFLRGFEYG